MNTSIYNNTFLNSMFTAEEFNFVKNMDSDSQEFDIILEKELHYRDTIVKFINSLRDNIEKNNVSVDNPEQLASFLQEAERCFGLVNQNIQGANENKEISEKLTQQIVELLIKVDSEGSNISASKFYYEISQIKDDISKFSTKLNSWKSELAKNDLQIKEFLNHDMVRQFLPSNLKLDSEPKPEPERRVRTYAYADVNKSKFDVPHGMKEENDTLLVSERERRVYLPYSKKEVDEYLEQYPDQYRSFYDVVKQEFIFPLSFYMKHPAIARFRESYALIRDRESKSIVEAFKLAMDMMFRHELNPAIIAACKSEEQLENYLDCLSKRKLDEFTDFKIKFEITPLKS